MAAELGWDAAEQQQASGGLPPARVRRKSFGHEQHEQSSTIFSPWTRAQRARVRSFSATRAASLRRRARSSSRSTRQPGWVEHRPDDIWTSQIDVARRALEQAHLQAGDIAAIGITNQRETTVVWDRTTGAPIYNAIVWQDRRTASICDDLRKSRLG